ncbi:MAG TPA: hypothetical protein VGB61_14060, partial [Pyrinomonadaceae bacterium]
MNFSAPGRNSENHHSATLLKDAAPGAPDASRSNDEVGTMNDEVKTTCLYFIVHRSYFIVS